jgi:Uma2 family endonuclease
MELLVEKVIDSGTPPEALSQYEIERNKPMPSRNHGFIQSKLSMIIGYRYLNTYNLFSELDIIMPEKPDSVPDICIYPKSEIDFSEDVIGMKEMPLTTIEILSPTQRENELVEKAKRYFAAGVKSCWIVLPIFKVIVVYSSPTQRQVFTEDMTLIDKITGIELSLNDVFS